MGLVRSAEQGRGCQREWPPPQPCKMRYSEGWSAPLWWPISEGGTREHECHADFRIDVRQEVGNPPRGMVLPIDKRWIAG
jgi:hypothetical protein